MVLSISLCTIRVGPGGPERLEGPALEASLKAEPKIKSEMCYMMILCWCALHNGALQTSLFHVCCRLRSNLADLLRRLIS